MSRDRIFVRSRAAVQASWPFRMTYSPQGRAERMIAVGRLVLAATSLLAVWLDPIEPSRYAAFAYALLVVYLLYALVLALLVWRWAVPLKRGRFIVHASDLAMFAVFISLTEGPTGPVYVYFVFAVLCAALRWHRRGALWTGLVALAVFVGLGLYAGTVLQDLEFDLNRFLIRGVYLAVIAVLVGGLGDYEQRTRSEMADLAEWPFDVPSEVRALAQTVFERVARILDIPRGIMVWEDPAEPWVHVASWSRGRFEQSREAPTMLSEMVDEQLTGSSFLCPNASDPKPVVLHTSASGVQRWFGAPVGSALRARFAIGAVLSMKLRGEGWEGRLFCLDRPKMTTDDLLLGEIVAHEVASRIDHFYMLERLKQAAAMEERVRFARDLHDGVLQSLASAALQLETARRELDGHPEAAHKRLLRVRQLIVDQQRDLRSLIRQLKPVPLAQEPAEPGLLARLRALAERAEDEWGLHVYLTVERLDTPVPDPLRKEIYHMVHEALVNVWRHAKASAASVELCTHDHRVEITIADDGHGFPFHGFYDLAALNEMGVGPKTLKERVAALGGTLVIDSTGRGARLAIGLPLSPDDA
jgi:signal transduction histidine kinase